jgi:hypothetical protein
VPRVSGPVALEYLDGGGLSRAVGPEETENLTGSNIKGDAVDPLHVAVRLSQVFNRDNGLHASDASLARFADKLGQIPSGELDGNVYASAV